MLTIEIRDYDDISKAELEVNLDYDGLELLMKKLNILKEKGGHVHLMTPAWAGSELDEMPLGQNTSILNHLRITFVSK